MHDNTKIKIYIYLFPFFFFVYHIKKNKNKTKKMVDDNDFKEPRYWDFLERISKIAPTPFYIISHRNMLKNPQNQTLNNLNYLNYIVQQYLNKNCNEIWDVMWFLILSPDLPESIKYLLGQMVDWITEYKNNPSLNDRLYNIMLNTEKIHAIIDSDEKYKKFKRIFKEFAWALERFWLYTQNSSYIIKMSNNNNNNSNSSSKFEISSNNGNIINYK